MTQSIGFVTIATGDEHYFRIARNLLRSYRHFTKNPLPFAILTDRENEYTKEFDQVVMLREPTGSYLDKLALYDHLPYDRCIFIDADCLAYGDLNVIFDHFKEADDMCCYGRVLPLDDTTGWFNYEDLGDLQSRVSYCVGLHGGIYYIRKTPVAKAVFDTANKIAADYHKYNFKGRFSTPGDEPIIALSMALNSCKPIPFRPEGICCYWEYENVMKLDIAKGEARIRPSGQATHLVHWGTRFTRGLLYRKQVAALMLENKPINMMLSNVVFDLKMTADRVCKFSDRVKNKLIRILHLNRKK